MTEQTKGTYQAASSMYNIRVCTKNNKQKQVLNYYFGIRKLFRANKLIDKTNFLVQSTNTIERADNEHILRQNKLKTAQKNKSQYAEQTTFTQALT